MSENQTLKCDAKRASLEFFVFSTFVLCQFECCGGSFKLRAHRQFKRCDHICRSAAVADLSAWCVNLVAIQPSGLSLRHGALSVLCRFVVETFLVSCRQIYCLSFVFLWELVVGAASGGRILGKALGKTWCHGLLSFSVSVQCQPLGGTCWLVGCDPGSVGATVPKEPGSPPKGPQVRLKRARGSHTKN